MPEHVYRLALPDAVYRDHGLRRYAFHGSSHRYVSHRAAELAGLSIGDSCWLSAHLGAHGSACAIVNGQSRDASMNLVMATRSGDIDPHLYTQLHRSLGWSLERIDQVLRQESGLLGLSELASDMRNLEKARDQGHAGATLAIEVYCYRLAKTLAAVGCALPQLDGLIFTGEIGENSPLVRSKTVDHLKLLNLAIDREANARCVRGVAGPIHSAAIRACWWCQPTKNARSPSTPWPCWPEPLSPRSPMHCFFIAPTGFGVGLTSTSLGLVRALELAGLQVGFLKPVAQPHPGDVGPERSTELVARTHGLKPPMPLGQSQVERMLADGQLDELLDEITGLYQQAAQGKDVVIVEGMVPTRHASYAARINFHLAKSLDADVILVSAPEDESLSELSDRLEIQAQQFGGPRDPKVLGVILNKVRDEDFAKRL
jgi:dethiobiotin synthetase